MTQTPQALVLLSDLMFQVKIAEAAKSAGVQALFVSSAPRLLQLATEEHPSVIILDINFAAADPVGVIRALKANPKTGAIPLVGYISHVQVELKAAAVAAGCDVVLARSAFVQNLSTLFARYLTTGLDQERPAVKEL